ncbi:MAG: recombinase family protein [Oscillospiraceae bacterium]|nr:recombinase family protein [Oscillospiraceae bacterium]
MKTVIYARYSSDNQREESVEGQIRECTEYAKHNGITIIGTYIDRALSAKTDNRPEFQRMIKDSAKKLFDVIIVWKLDRFARNRYDSAHYKSILRKNGVKIISAKENISEGPEGIILESMLEGMAEYYSAELSQKVSRGMTENALKGKNNGGGIPLGYLLGGDQKLVIDPITAPLVQEAFTRYAEGETMRAIVESFNERGLTTKKNQPFNINSFNVLFNNRKYIGEYKYKEVVISGGVPALVSEEVFERVQERKQKNKRAPARAKADEEYLLTTKLLCGDCGRLLIGESGTSKTGKVHYYYKCGGAKRRSGCKKKTVKKDWIERIAVVWTVNKVLKDEEIDRIADKLVDMQERENTLLPTLRQQLAETNKGIDNLLNAIQQGLYNAAAQKRMDELEARKADLEVSILQAELTRPKYSKDEMVRWIGQFKHGDVDSVDYQRQIIDIFINSIRIFDDKIIFTYNYKDGTEVISLADIHAALGSDFGESTPPNAP